MYFCTPVAVPFWAQFFPLEPSQMQPVTTHSTLDLPRSLLQVYQLHFFVFHVMSDGSLPNVCHYTMKVAIFSAPGTFFGTHHPVPKSIPHYLGFYYTSIHLPLSISVPDGFSYHISNHKISMTCNDIHYFFCHWWFLWISWSRCASGHRSVVCLEHIGLTWFYMSQAQGEGGSDWAYSFQSRYWKFPWEEEKYLSSGFITGTLLSIPTFLWSKQLIWPTSTSVEWGSVLHPRR